MNDTHALVAPRFCPLRLASMRTLVAALLSLPPLAARAEGAKGGEIHPTPNAPAAGTLTQADHPTRAPAPVPRRSFELATTLSTGSAVCEERPVGTVRVEDGCSTVEGAQALGLHGFYFVSPRLAVGLRVQRRMFDWSPRVAYPSGVGKLVATTYGAGGGPGAGAGWQWVVGPAVKAHVLEGSMFDPYGAFAVGVASTTLQRERVDGEIGSTSMTSELTAGIDVHPTPHLTFGPWVSVTRRWATGGDRCDGRACVEPSGGAPSVAGWVDLGLSATMSFGDEL